MSTPSATVNNEAAERLHNRIDNWPINAVRKLEGHNDLAAALVAHRRVTVERIRERLTPGFQGEVFMLIGAENTSLIRTETILAILDEEASR